MNKILKIFKKFLHPFYLLISWLHKKHCDECENQENEEDLKNE